MSGTIRVRLAERPTSTWERDEVTEIVSDVVGESKSLSEIRAEINRRLEEGGYDVSVGSVEQEGDQ